MNFTALFFLLYVKVYEGLICMFLHTVNVCISTDTSSDLILCQGTVLHIPCIHSPVACKLTDVSLLGS